MATAPAAALRSVPLRGPAKWRKEERLQGYRPRYGVKQGRLKLLRAMEKIEAEEGPKILKVSASAEVLEEPLSPQDSEDSSFGSDDDATVRTTRSYSRPTRAPRKIASRRELPKYNPLNRATALFTCGVREVAHVESSCDHWQTWLEPADSDAIGVEEGDFIASVACSERSTIAATARGKVVGWGGGILFDDKKGSKTTLSKSFSNSTLSSSSIFKTTQASQSRKRATTTGLDKLKAMRDNKICKAPAEIEPAPASRVRAVLGSIVSARSVSCGPEHALVVTADGQVYSWGRGDNGRLGHGDCLQRFTPTLIEAFAGKFVATASCGGAHAAAIVRVDATMNGGAAGQLYTWGDGRVGQLGHDDHLDDFLALEADELRKQQQSATRDYDDYSLEDYRRKRLVSSPTLVAFFERRASLVRQVACGLHHTVAIAWEASCEDASKVVARLYAWGFGDEGRLGVGDDTTCATPTRVLIESEHLSMVAAGDRHSLALTSDGTLFSWGDNTFGQLGLDQPVARWPVRVPLLPTKDRLLSIACGARHSAAVSRDGDVLLWGFGEEGQLGGGPDLARKRGTENIDPGLARSRPISVTDNGGKRTWVADAVALGVRHSVVLCRNARAGVTRTALADAAFGGDDTTKTIAEDRVVFVKEEERATTLTSEPEEEEEAPPVEAEKKPLPQPAVRLNAQDRRELLERRLGETRQRRRRERDRILREQKKTEPSLKEEEEPEALLPVVVAEEQPVVVDVVDETLPPAEEEEESPLVVEEEEEDKATEEEAAAPPTVEAQTRVEFNDIFYRDSQDADKCFVGHAARRARGRSNIRKRGIPSATTARIAREIRKQERAKQKKTPTFTQQQKPLPTVAKTSDHLILEDDSSPLVSDEEEGEGEEPTPKEEGNRTEEDKKKKKDDDNDPVAAFMQRAARNAYKAT